jgi:hypothetical protein
VPRNFGHATVESVNKSVNQRENRDKHSGFGEELDSDVRYFGVRQGSDKPAPNSADESNDGVNESYANTKHEAEFY